MNTPKHTPAPWKIGKKAKLFVQTCEEVEGRICVVDEFDEERAEANAHLIAAAPDLLEALEVILNCSSVDMDTSEITLKRYDALNIARKAIAKARGES